MREIAAVCAVSIITFATSFAASAADFDWKKFQGKTVTFLANNNPVSQAMLSYKAEFEKLTGMTLKVDATRSSRCASGWSQ